MPGFPAQIPSYARRRHKPRERTDAQQPLRSAAKPATAQRRAKGAPSGARGSISAKRRAAMRDQGRYMSAIRTLSTAQRAQVKKLRAAKGAEAAITLARKLRR